MLQHTPVLLVNLSTGILDASKQFMLNSTEFAIWPPYEAFYIESMLFNAESAMQSILNVTELMNALEAVAWQEARERIDNGSLLNELQNIVLQGAALSRYFWPSRSRIDAHARRGILLRSALEVSDDSPLRSRKLRNALEHFDERLDLYLQRGVVGAIYPEYVGPKPEEDEVRAHIFRAFYLDTVVFVLLGEEFEVRDLVLEIDRVYEGLQRCRNAGGRLSTPRSETRDHPSGE